jgi:hypothetical protein
MTGQPLSEEREQEIRGVAGYYQGRFTVGVRATPMIRDLLFEIDRLRAELSTERKAHELADSSWRKAKAEVARLEAAIREMIAPVEVDVNGEYTTTGDNPDWRVVGQRALRKEKSPTWVCPHCREERSVENLQCECGYELGGT